MASPMTSTMPLPTISITSRAMSPPINTIDKTGTGAGPTANAGAGSPSPPQHRPVMPRSRPPRVQSNPIPTTSTSTGIRPPRRPSNSHAHSQPLMMSSSGSSPPGTSALALSPSAGQVLASAAGSAIVTGSASASASALPSVPLTDAVNSANPAAAGTTTSGSSASATIGPLSSLQSSGTGGAGMTGTSSPPSSLPTLASGPSSTQVLASTQAQGQGQSVPMKKARSDSSSSGGQRSGAGAGVGLMGGTAVLSAGAGQGLAPLSSGPTPAPPTASGMTAGTSSTSAVPQTGASKMAAAAKARAEGIPPKRRGSDVQAEDHPLGEQALKERDYHTIVTMNRLFHVPSRWRLIRPLGQGAYGLVIQVQDSYTGEPVAVKCITRVFDKVILARRALREITLLRHFGGHENLTSLIDLDKVWDGYNEIYLYMEPMEADLHQIVRSGQTLSNSHIQFFTYQLLRGMKYIHSANVIHRDLKPGNLLVNSDCELKICDFGLARGYRPQGSAEDGMKLTEYVATRWYRAPEVMLSNSSYTTSMDVWSIGCILAELLGGKPIFKGKDYVDQINLIIAAIGTPDEETLTRVGSEKACSYMRSLPFSEPKDLNAMLPLAEPDAIDLLRHLITFDPSQRYTVVQALEHDYVGSYHVESDEPTCPAVFDKWEQVESLTTIEELREAISREIEEYRAEVRSAAYLTSSDEGSEMGDADDEEYLREDGQSVGDWEGDATITARSLEAAYGDGERRGSGSGTGGVPFPRSSPEALQSQLGVAAGISPKTNTSALPPHQRGRERERERERSPHTPASVFTDDSTPGPSQPPSAPPSVFGGGGGGRTSRRSSAHSTHRARSSFLFSSPLGGGMTPLPSMSAIFPASGAAGAGAGAGAASVEGGHAYGHGQRSGSIDATSSAHSGYASASGTGAGTGTGTTSNWMHGRKSRQPSSTSEFASLRPLIRQLSVVGLDSMGLDADGKSKRGGEDGAAGPGAGDGAHGQEMSEVPPMTVSPSDAPPSERPKSFAPTPR